MMQTLILKILLVSGVFASWSYFMFDAGVDHCKAEINEKADDQFEKQLNAKQSELDAAIELSNQWRKKVDDLQKIKAPKVKHEKQNIKNDNSGCDSIDGFRVFWLKLQERNAPESAEPNRSGD